MIFEDYTVEVQGELDERIGNALEEAAGEIESQAKRNSRVDTGRTKGSYQHRVNGSFMVGQFIAYIGSDYENAIWEEFGTGEYALHGDGRKGGWHYKDANGVWHYTKGKTPRRALFRAFTSCMPKITKHFQDMFSGF